MTAPAARKRDLAFRLSLGFIEDRNGNRRKVQWPLVALFGALLPLSTLFGVYRSATTSVPAEIWVCAILLYTVSVLAINILYHRGRTHGGLEFPAWVEVILLIAAALAWQGNIWDWVTKHRMHHAKADVIGCDPHSPWEYPGWKGLLWAQWFWLFFLYELPANYAPKDLRENPRVRWHRGPFGFMPIAILGLAIPFLLYGWNGLLICGFLRIACSMTAVGWVNSICHMWGTRTTDSNGRAFVEDDSRNNVLVSLLTFGEGEHNGHHADEQSPRHGWHATLSAEAIDDGVVPDRDWRPDLTWRVIQGMAFCRLLRITYKPPESVQFSSGQVAPKKALLAIHEQDAMSSRAGRRMAAVDRERQLAMAGSASAS